MKAVWKFVVDAFAHGSVVEMPIDSVPLTAGFDQDGDLVVWAEVETRNPATQVRFHSRQRRCNWSWPCLR